MRHKCSTFGLLLALVVVGPIVAQEPAGDEAPSGGVDARAASEAADRAATEEPAAPAGPDLTEVNALIRDGAYEQAEPLLVALGESHADDPRLLLMHGEVLLALARPAEALVVLRRAAEVDGDRPRVHFQLATALQHTGDREAAIEHYGRELAVNDDSQVHVFARLNRSLLLGQLERWAEAAMELEAVVAIEPDRRQAYGDMATLYLQANKLEEAARSLERGLDAGYVSARHLHALAARYFKDEAYGDAVEILQQAIRIDPNMPEAQQTLATALDRLGREKEALPHLRRYLELKPDAPDAQQVSEWIQALESR